MPDTYTLIASSTVGSTAVSSIDFTSIPNTYKDLKVVYSLRTNLSGGPYYFDDLGVRLNGDTGTNYSRISLRAREGSVASNKTTTTSFLDIYSGNAGNATTSAFANGDFYIPSYTSSSAKSFGSDGVSETNSTNDVQSGFASGIWNSSSAVTSIKIFSQNATSFVQYSTAYLYGISNS